MIHLARMNTDCKYMEKLIAELKDSAQETMQKKFGVMLKLDDLEETILKKFVYNHRANVDDLHTEYRRRATELKVTIL